LADGEATILSLASLAVRVGVAQMVVLMAEQPSQEKYDPGNIPDTIVAVVSHQSEENVVPETEF
jgi:hypothetical protein